MTPGSAAPPSDRLEGDERDRYRRALCHHHRTNRAWKEVRTRLTPLHVVDALVTSSDVSRADHFASLFDRKPDFIEDLLRPIRGEIVHVGVDSSRLAACINGMKRSLIAGREPSNALFRTLADVMAECEAVMGAIPPSFGKTVEGARINAEQMPSAVEISTPFLEHPNADPEMVDALQRLVEERGVDELTFSDHFRDGPAEPAVYAMMGPRGRERNADFVRRTEETIAADLAEHAQSWKDHLGYEALWTDGPHYRGPELLIQAAWLYRCCANPAVRRRFADRLAELGGLLLRMRRPSGAWTRRMPDPQAEGPVFVGRECPLITALVANALHDLSEVADFSEAVEGARGWLLRQQRPDGAIPDIDGEDRHVAAITALTCLVATRTLGRDMGSVARAERWLLEHQDEFGFWEGHAPLGEFAITAIVLRHVFASEEPRRELRHWGVSAQRFLTLAEGLLERTDEAAVKMALVASFHAVEFALYEVLTRPEIGGDIHRGKGSETIGASDAMAQLAGKLRATGALPPGAGLKLNAQVKEHKADRDAVIHRNQNLDPASARRHVDVARRFVIYVFELP